MLLEPVNYYRNLNFAIEFSNVAEEAPHYHKETEMALILRGNATYRIHHQEFHLKTGDAIVVDTKDLHYITDSSEDVIMLTFYINMEAFTHLYPNIDFMIFACEEFSQDVSERHQKMQNKISFLIHHMAEMLFLSKNPDTEDLLLEEKLQEILYLMVNHFQGFFIEDREFRLGNNDANPADLDRLYRIITYMYQNYDKKITLQDVAEMEHLSMYYASHMIKKLSGLSFQNLLNYIRVENSEKLLNDKYTLTQISEDCGFSSLAYYNKCFKIWHGITPAQYRRQPRPSSRSFHKPFDQGDALKLLEPYLNVELPDQQEDDNRFSTHHIFIPIRSEYNEGAPLQHVLPLNVMLDSPDELSEYKDILLSLTPDSISTGIALYRNLSVKTAADALEYMLREHSPHIHMAGSANALLDADKMPTPFYSLFRSLSLIKGQVCEQQQQYILIKSDSSISVILFNTDMCQPLNVYLQFNHSNRPDFMIRKSIRPEHCIDHIKKIAGDADIRDHIFDLVSGSAELIETSDYSGLHLPVTVAPGEVTTLTF